jgi:hypothetical protein
LQGRRNGPSTPEKLGAIDLSPVPCGASFIADACLVGGAMVAGIWAGTNPLSRKNRSTAK